MKNTHSFTVIGFMTDYLLRHGRSSISRAFSTPLWFAPGFDEGRVTTGLELSEAYRQQTDMESKEDNGSG